MDDQFQDLPNTLPFHKDSVLPTSDRWLRWGSLSLLGSWGLALGIVHTLSVDVTVRAYGQLRPTEPAYQVTASQSGTIAALHVNENDAVVTGQVIAELSPHDRGANPNEFSENSPDIQPTSVTHPIYAPVNGFVLRLGAMGPGQVIQPGMALAEIMPLSAPLRARVILPPSEVGRIASGQSVQMQVAAYPYPEYGTLPGTIVAISPDVVPCPFSSCTIPEGYRVDIELEQTQMESSVTAEQYRLQPGLPVTADIVTHRAKLITLILNKLRLSTP